MPKVFSDAETPQKIADELIPEFHSELIDARIRYIFVDSMKSKGRSVWGKVQKMTGVYHWMLEKDFLITINQEKWNEAQSGEERIAAMDDLLERCTVEEDEDSGERSWVLREPDVQEFTTIFERRGAWHAGLEKFVSIAQAIHLDDLVKQETGGGENGVDLGDILETEGENQETEGAENGEIDQSF